MTRYRVVVADNFDYMEESAHVDHGEFETAEAAIAECRRLVDSDLAHMYTPGMTASELYDHYTSFGDDPFIRALGDEVPTVRFSAWDYARERCTAICAPPP